MLTQCSPSVSKFGHKTDIVDHWQITNYPLQVRNGVQQRGKPLADAHGADEPLGRVCEFPATGRLLRRR